VREVSLNRRTFGTVLLGAALAAASVLGHESAWGVEVGQPAPDFTMPSTQGGDISLRDFRGKRWVLLEFYGADFAPT
jgi:hypothetical protein